MRTNLAVKTPAPQTHEGAPAARIDAVAQLRRSVMACMLFEDTFYESGEAIAQRIHDEVAAVLQLANGADIVANIAYEARTKFKLRHAPLWLALALVRANTAASRAVVAGLLAEAIQRPDEIPEFLAMLWKEKKTPIPNQVKKGLAAAFRKFDRYSLSKYANREGAVSLRDVLFLTHAKPAGEEQAALWKDLAEKKLTAPDTWEANLSAGADKAETFTRLLTEKKLGALALLRNLRNMQQVDVSNVLIAEALRDMKTERVLPFRFITAARYAPMLEPALESAMFRCLEGAATLPGKTVLVVDNSGSMYGVSVSKRSELDRSDAACALAMLLREVCESCQVISYATTPAMVPPRRGFALRNAIRAAVPTGSTNTAAALEMAALMGYDRIIVITDEQSANAVGAPFGKGYFINVANYQNGIGYGPWTHIDGWSESVVEYIQQAEAAV